MGKTSKSQKAKRNVKSKRNMKSKRHRMTSKKNSRKSVTRRRRMKGGDNEMTTQLLDTASTVGAKIISNGTKTIQSMGRTLRNSRAARGAARGAQELRTRIRDSSIRQDASKMVSKKLGNAQKFAHNTTKRVKEQARSVRNAMHKLREKVPNEHESEPVAVAAGVEPVEAIERIRRIVCPEKEENHE